MLFAIFTLFISLTPPPPPLRYFIDALMPMLPTPTAFAAGLPLPLFFACLFFAAISSRRAYAAQARRMRRRDAAPLREAALRAAR
jgi:hypothetical protein